MYAPKAFTLLIKLDFTLPQHNQLPNIRAHLFFEQVMYVSKELSTSKQNVKLKKKKKTII